MIWASEECHSHKGRLKKNGLKNERRLNLYLINPFCCHFTTILDNQKKASEQWRRHGVASGASCTPTFNRAPPEIDPDPRRFQSQGKVGVGRSRLFSPESESESESTKLTDSDRLRASTYYRFTEIAMLII